MTQRRRLFGLYAGLGAANLLAWLWAWAAFRGSPMLLGTALLAYGFGLRHAVDADHIAAIDNVTRKLMQEGKRPIGVGFFFALGHSTVVVAASVAIALTASTLQARFPGLVAAGGVIGTAVSAAFLFAIAILNLAVLVGVFRVFRRVRRGGACEDIEIDRLLARRGLLGRVFRLGFDTATEIGLLGISAAEAVKGLPIWSILVFPALFTAGMSLIDTTDGVLMLGAYGWAFVDPVRKLYYNLTITGISVAVAVAIGGIEALGLAAEKLGLEGGLWDAAGAAAEALPTLGYAIVAIFAASWLVSFLVYRMRGDGKLSA